MFVEQAGVPRNGGGVGEEHQRSSVAGRPSQKCRFLVQGSGLFSEILFGTIQAVHACAGHGVIVSPM